MARIVVPGDIHRSRFVPSGWKGQCLACGSVVVTGSEDLNLGDGFSFFIACLTPRCEGRIMVLAPRSHTGFLSNLALRIFSRWMKALDPGSYNGVHALTNEYTMLTDK